MIPMDPAKAVINVRPFLVIRLLKDNAIAVKNDMAARFAALAFWCFSERGSNGSVSEEICPSNRLTVRVAYCSANSGLCVTIMTSRSDAICVSRSIICTLVAESRAPVGSSARSISGSLISALAIATRCICPPDNWLGFLLMCSMRPTRSSSAIARSRRSARETPVSVNANSTFARTVW